MKPPRRHKPGSRPTAKPHSDKRGEPGRGAAPGAPKGPRPPAPAARTRDTAAPPPTPAAPERGRGGWAAKGGWKPKDRPPAEAGGGADRPPPAAYPDERRPAPRTASADAPKGTVWLYGVHAVAAALANPARRLRRLMLTENAEAAMIQAIRPPWPITPERTDRARLDKLLGATVVHQGVALLTDVLPTPALQQALERPGPVLVLDHVSDPRNIGAILRSAAAFGVAAVVMQDRNAPEETGALAKAASGALETVPILRAVNIARTMVALRAAGLWLVGLDASGTTLSGPALAQRRVALVLGSEGEGMRRLTRETCDELAAIAMPGAEGGLDSLNVSAAAAIALYELARSK